MARDLFNKYIWLVDTIRSYGRISRAELDRLWRLSQFSEGEGLPRRTFHNYRQAAEELFNIEIKCDPSTYEYYIEDTTGGEQVTDWLLNTAVTHEVLSKSTDVADRISVEDVPSAREYLAPAVDALRDNRRVKFDYQAYYRSQPTRDIVFEPYFLKLFRQRWYMVGLNVEQKKIKTYALDRIVRIGIFPLRLRYSGGPGHRAHSVAQGGPAPDQILPRAASACLARRICTRPLLHFQIQTAVERRFCGAAAVVRRPRRSEPRELRIRIVRELESALNNYNTTAESSQKAGKM